MRSLAALVTLALPSLAQLQIVEVQKLLGSTSNAQDRFGTAVDLDGERMVSGSPQNGDAASTAGAVFVFDRQADGSWLETAVLLASDAASGDQLGTSVALSGDRAIAGAPQHDAAGADAGAAYVLERQPDGTWTETKLTASDAEAGDRFGFAVDIDADHAVVGAWRESTTGNLAGAAYVFERQPDGSWPQVQKLLASDGAALDAFGWSVAVSGDRLAVGAETWDQSNGKAYVFERQAGGLWLEVDDLLPSDSTPLSHFGHAVAMDGDLLVVGAERQPIASTPLSDYGAAYVFERSGGGSWNQVERLFGSDTADDDWFGYGVDIDGEDVVVGARNHDELGNNAGATYLFERTGPTTWTEVGEVAGLDTTSGDLYGLDVTISDGRFVVGAPNDDDLGSESGSAYVHDPEPLSGAPASVSVSAGGSQALELDAGHPNGGALYLLLGTLSGTSPGFPYGGVLVPLNPDDYFTLTLNNPNQPPLASSFGMLGAVGHATASFTLPPGTDPAAAGLTAHHAFGTIDPFTLLATFVSNPLPVLLAP